MTAATIGERVRGLSEAQLRAFRQALGKVASEDSAQLVAYLKVNLDKELDTKQIREWLSGQLPDYMIPSRFEQVVALPRLANGKIDRKQLTTCVVVEHRPEHREKSPPQAERTQSDDLESELAALWARSLNTDYVLPDDDFFELGGHSLLGVQLLLDVKVEFGTEIPLADLFEASRLTDMVSQIRRSNTSLGVVATIQRGKDQTPIFSVHGGDKTLGAAFGPDRPLYLVFDSISTTSADMSSVETVAEYYLRGVRTVQPHGPYILCGYSLGGMIAYEMAMRLTEAGEEVRLVGLFDSTPPHIGRWGLGLRLYNLVARLGDQKGLLDKAKHLLSNASGILRRRIDGLREDPVAASRGAEHIREANEALYYEIGFKYRYPISRLNCVVYMPDWHPRWVRHLRQKWQRVMLGELRVRCVEGAREHMDITRPPYDQLLAQRFVDNVNDVEAAAADASGPPA